MTVDQMPTLAPDYQLNLRPVLFIDLVMKDGCPEQVISNKSKNLCVGVLTGGFIKSVDPEYPFDADIKFGFDDATALTSSNTINLDCKVYAATKKGKGVYLTYTGVAEWCQELTELKENSVERYLSFDDVYISINTKFQLDDEIDEEYKWVRDINFIGKGRFVRDAKGILRVQYHMFILA